MNQTVVRSIESPVGQMRIGATKRGVCLLEFCDRRALPTEIAFLEKKTGALETGTNKHTERMADELERYFDGKLTEFGTPLDIFGTTFQRRIWEELGRIPYGETISYGELARRAGRPGAQRAVGQANGANRIAIVIPCHRVVRSDGKLHGYGGGLWRKQFLLGLESAEESLLAGATCAPSPRSV